MHLLSHFAVIFSFANCASVAELTLPPRVRTENDNATFELQDFSIAFATNFSSIVVQAGEDSLGVSSVSTPSPNSAVSTEGSTKHPPLRRSPTPSQADIESENQDRTNQRSSWSAPSELRVLERSASNGSTAWTQPIPLWTNGTSGSQNRVMPASTTAVYQPTVKSATAVTRKSHDASRANSTTPNEGPYTITQGGAKFAVSKVGGSTSSKSSVDHKSTKSSATSVWLDQSSETNALVVYDGGAPDAFWQTHTLTVGTAINYPQAMSYVPQPTMPSIPNPQPTGDGKPPLAVYFSNTTFAATFYIDNGTDNFRAALYDNFYSSCDQYGGQCEGETATFSLDGGWMVVHNIPVKGTIEFTVGPFQFQSDAWRDYLVSSVVTAIVTPAANNSCHDESFTATSCDFGLQGCSVLDAPGITRDDLLHGRDVEVSDLDARIVGPAGCHACKGHMNVCNIPEVALIQAAHPDQSSGYNEIQVQLKYNIDKQYIQALEMACNFGIDLFFGLLGTFFPKAKSLENVVKKQTKKLCDKAITKELGAANAGASGGLGDDSDPLDNI